MENNKSLFEQHRENKIKHEKIKSIVNEIAERTDDIDFKLFNESIKIQDRIGNLSDINAFTKYTSEDKYKVINFYKQIANLLDDFLKEMDINE